MTEVFAFHHLLDTIQSHPVIAFDFTFSSVRPLLAVVIDEDDDDDD